MVRMPVERLLLDAGLVAALVLLLDPVTEELLAVVVPVTELEAGLQITIDEQNVCAVTVTVSRHPLTGTTIGGTPHGGMIAEVHLTMAPLAQVSSEAVGRTKSVLEGFIW